MYIQSLYHKISEKITQLREMDSDLNCPLCQDQFTDQNLPRLLTKCGHTFCENCLKKIITQKKGSYKLVCPQDGEMITLKDNNLNNFPKNIALIKFIEVKKNNSLDFKDADCQISKICKTQQNQQDEDTRDIVSSIYSPNNTKGEDAINKEINQNQQQRVQKQQKLQKVQNVLKQQNVITKKSNQPEVKHVVEAPKAKVQQKQLCKTHGKPLQVVCIIDLKKICTNCAIFGEHKGHDFKSMEQIEKQRLDYYHAIISIMEKKETVSERISSESTCSSIMQILGKKKQNMRKSINEKYQDLISAIKTRQKQSMKSLENVILKTESKLKNLMKIDKSTLDKYDKWEQRSYKEIKVLQSNNFQSKLQLLFVTSMAEGDVLQEGDGIIEQMYKQEENLINQVQVALENIGVDFNQEIFNFVDGFVELYDQKKKKNKGKIGKVQTEKTHISNSNNYSSPINSKANSHVNQLGPNTNELQKVSSKIQYIQIQGPKSPPNNQQSLLEMLQDIQEKKIDNHNMKDTYTFSVKNTPDKNEKSDLNLILSQKKFQSIITQFQEFQKKEEHIKMKSPQLTQRSNKKEEVSSFIQEKPNRKKLASKIKVTEKYEKMLEGLVNDQLQTVDFTNAQLGDAAIIQICELISGSKAKTVKLIRNKLNDETIQKILPHLTGVITLNLSQNFLTDRSLDLLFNGKDHLQSIKSIILCQNKIIDRKHKAKIDKLKSLDITVSV